MLDIDKMLKDINENEDLAIIITKDSELLVKSPNMLTAHQASMIFISILMTALKARDCHDEIFDCIKELIGDDSVVESLSTLYLEHYASAIVKGAAKYSPVKFDPEDLKSFFNDLAKDC